MQGVKNIIGSFIAILVGAVLVAPINTVVIDANVTGIAGTVVSLIPLFFALTILMVSLKGIT